MTSCRSAVRSYHNMWSNISSPAASSTGQNGLNSPYEVLNSPSNSGSAPSLQLTLSHNGSDTSDSSTWVPVNPAGEPNFMAAGSAGASSRQSSLRENAKNPQKFRPHSIAQHSGDDSSAFALTVQGLHPSFPNFNVFPGLCRITPQSLRSESPTRSQAISHHSRALASGSDGCPDIQWLKPIAETELLWNGGRLATMEQPAVGESSHETIPVSTSYSQAATIDPALQIGDDSIALWKAYILKPHHQFDDPKPLLGIPPQVGVMPEFGSTAQDLFWEDPAEEIQIAAGVYSPKANSSIKNFLDCNILSVIPPEDPRATLTASSTSSTGSHPPSRVPGRMSILPVAGPRVLKRPIEDDLCEVPETTKLPRYAAVGAEFPRLVYETTNHSYNSNLVFFPQTRHRAIDDMANAGGTSWFPQSAIPGLGVDRHSVLTHEQHEAEEFSPPAGSLAMYGVDRIAHHFESGNNISPQLHVGQHPCDSDEFHDQSYRGLEAPVSGLLGVSDWNSNLEYGRLNFPGDRGFLGSPAISIQPHTDATMEDSVGGDGSDIHSIHVNVGDIPSSFEFSSNPDSPSPAITPGESPDLVPTISFGPVRPPQTHHYSSSIGYPFPGEDANARGSNSPLDNRLEWTQQAMAVSLHVPPPCIYVPQPQENGEEYEAEAEDNQFDFENHTQIGTATALSQHQIPPKKRRRAFPEDRRAAVHDVRKLGACIRCQYLRESCDMGSPCGNCRKVDGKQKIWGSMPCLRLRITDAMLFRKGNSKFQQERATPLPTPKWKPHTVRRELSLGRAPPMAEKYWGPQPKYPELRIQCQEFIPRKNDLLFETWNEDGQEKKIYLPAFAACELQDVSLAVRNFVRETFDLFKNDMVSEENPLVKLVFREAIRYTEAHQCAKENKKGTHQEACMLKDALKIWILTRLAYEGFGIIRGHEEFGVDVINDPKSPYHGTVPIPPILDHQLDTVGIHEMIRLKDNVLKALRARIQKRRESQWYEVFLTIFVLLHNLEYIARKQYLYTKRHESTWASNREKSVEFFRTTWMAEWETAANMLIKHFQVALKGAVPFTFDWEGSEDGKGSTGSDGAKGKRKSKGKRKADPVVEAKEKAGMDDAGVDFMKDVCRLVRASEPDFQRLRLESERRKYDRDMVWVSQLFLDVE